jgi:hypothetical protein
MMMKMINVREVLSMFTFFHFQGFFRLLLQEVDSSHYNLVYDNRTPEVGTLICYTRLPDHCGKNNEHFNSEDDTSATGGVFA